MHSRFVEYINEHSRNIGVFFDELQKGAKCWSVADSTPEKLEYTLWDATNDPDKLAFALHFKLIDWSAMGYTPFGSLEYPKLHSSDVGV